MNDPPAPRPEKDEDETEGKGWDHFLQQHQPGSDPETSDSQKEERPFSDLYREAMHVLHLESPPASDVDRLVQQIDLTVIPTLCSKLDDENDGPQSEDEVRLRIDAWQSLAVALRTGDANSRERCEALWDAVGVAEIAPAKLSPQVSSQKPTPQVFHEFQRALAEFTPKLIATPAIIAINAAVFVTMVICGVGILMPDPEMMLSWGANFGPLTLNGEWWRTTTSMFLHFGIIHIAFNMWVLWMLGRLVERLVGNIGFVVLYFASGIAGSLASLAWNAQVISAGASGAVFGIAGALLGLIAFSRNSIPTSILTSLRSSLLTFLAYNFLFGAVAQGIDMAAHVGGFVAGFFGGILLSQPISAEAVKRRPIRNGSLAAISVAALLAAANALPPAPVNLRAELAQFVTMEDEAIRLNNALIESFDSGQLSASEFAERIEREILPAWSESRKKLNSLSDSPQVDPTAFPKLLSYLRSREESWQARVESLRSQDAELANLATQKWQEAEESAKALRSN